MSIINDALKKIQKNIDSTRSTPRVYGVPEKKSTISTPSEPKPRPSRRPGALRIWSSMVSLIILGIGIIITRKQISTTLIPRQHEHSPSRPDAAAIRSTEAPPRSALFPEEETIVQNIEKKIRLNGTLMMNDKRVALINNNIYETGEMVDGYQIFEITLQGVQLEKNGKKFTLRVKNTKTDSGNF